MSVNESPSSLRVGVLLSGEGTSLENLFERIEAGEVPATIAVVISSKEGVGGLHRAERRGVPAVAIPRKRHRDLREFNDLIHAELEKHGVEFVALLGFLSPFELRGKFEGRAINVHPALIPAFSGKGFYGRKVYDAVFAKGVKVTGATVHFVDEEYDHGPIILQEAVSVLEDDTVETLSARVQAAERRLVPEAIRLFAEGRLEIDSQRRVRIRKPG
jgi:phosphoribosylglycinamide formyltransferase-1